MKSPGVVVDDKQSGVSLMKEAEAQVRRPEVGAVVVLN